MKTKKITQFVTNLKKIKFGKTKKTQIMTKLKNSNCDKTQKLKLRQNSKTQIVTKRNLNCDNPKTQIVT